MIVNHFFKFYSVVSLVVPCYIVANAMNNHDTLFGLLVYLTSQKLNLLIFFNAVFMIVVLFTNMLIYVFFGDILIIEQKVSPYLNANQYSFT